MQTIFSDIFKQEYHNKNSSVTYWLNNMDNIISLVSSGKLVRKRIWLGGCAGIAVGVAGCAGGAAAMAAKNNHCLRLGNNIVFLFNCNNCNNDTYKTGLLNIRNTSWMHIKLPLF